MNILCLLGFHKKSSVIVRIRSIEDESSIEDNSITIRIMFNALTKVSN